MNFHQLHQNDSPLLLGNVWDVPSALACQANSLQALGTSSAAMAALLGYPDGEQIPFADVLRLTERILQCVQLPVSVDLESGYSRVSSEIADHINQLTSLGVVGVNLEDTLSTPSRRLREMDDFAETIASVRTQLTAPVFLNVRTDTFLLNHPDPVQETIRRAKRYALAGADGLFVPGIIRSEDIAAVVAATQLPLNVMCFPALPDFTELARLGVKRISMGNFLHASQTHQLKESISTILNNGNFSSVC